MLNISSESIVFANSAVVVFGALKVETYYCNNYDLGIAGPSQTAQDLHFLCFKGITPWVDFSDEKKLIYIVKLRETKMTWMDLHDKQ